MSIRWRHTLIIVGILSFFACSSEPTLNVHDASDATTDAVYRDATTDSADGNAVEIFAPIDVHDAKPDTHRDNATNDAAQDEFLDSESVDSSDAEVTEDATDVESPDAIPDALDASDLIAADSLIDVPETLSPFVSEYLCRACITDADCRNDDPRNANNRCIERNSVGSFCGQNCMSDNKCPDGYGCIQIHLDSTTINQCQPLEGQECPCPDNFINYKTHCWVENQFGRCWADRTCQDNDCPALTPAEETCDGVDNDCDDATDEELTRTCS